MFNFPPNDVPRNIVCSATCSSFKDKKDTLYCLDCNGFGYRLSVDSYEIDFIRRKRDETQKTTEQIIIKNLNYEENAERLREAVILFKKKFPYTMKKLEMKEEFDYLF